MSMTWPQPPEAGGKLTSRLTVNNWRHASLIRFHKQAGFIRVYVVATRYFDRGAGGFMGSGAFVQEGRVVCESYPAATGKKLRVPALKSVAGWGYAGPGRTNDGVELDISDPNNLKTYVDNLSDEFWAVGEAISYANGEAGGALALETEPVRVTWSRAGYRLSRIDA
jgi:hypothetical protein